MYRDNWWKFPIFLLKAPKYLGFYGLQPLQQGTLSSSADRKNIYTLYTVHTNERQWRIILQDIA